MSHRDALRSRDRPHARTRHRRVGLLACIAVGVLVPVYFLAVAEVSHLAWDFRAYYAAAEAALAGERFVGIHTGVPGVSYVYPPVSVALFVPQAAAGGWRLAFALQTALNAGAALALASLALRTVESRRGRLPSVDRRLVTGFCVASAPAVAVLGQGQVDLFIALALAVAFLAVERDRQALAGVTLAGAALVKVFPVALGLWLVWRRAWRAVGAALATGVAGLLVGWAWFGLDAYRRYLGVLAGRSRIEAFAGTVSPNFFAMSLYRPLSQLLPTVDPHLYGPLAALAVAPTVVLVARFERGFVDRLTTYLVAVAAMVLVSPASNALYVVYVYFPVLCLLYLGAPGRGRSALLAGTVAIGIPVQPAQVGAALAAVGVPGTIRGHLLSVVREALTVASLPLLGLLTIFGWAMLRALRPAERSTVDAAPARAD